MVSKDMRYFVIENQKRKPDISTSIFLPYPFESGILAKEIPNLRIFRKLFHNLVVKGMLNIQNCDNFVERRRSTPRTKELQESVCLVSRIKADFQSWIFYYFYGK